MSPLLPPRFTMLSPALRTGCGASTLEEGLWRGEGGVVLVIGKWASRLEREELSDGRSRERGVA